MHAKVERVGGYRRGRTKKVHQEGTAADPVETVLMSFFNIFWQSLGSLRYRHVQWAVSRPLANTERRHPQI